MGNLIKRLIVVDDLGFITCEGARHAVAEFLEETPRDNAFHLLTGGCLLVPGAAQTGSAT